ncbi:MAG: amidase [Ectothiorhodospiraceae bacterium]|nr:amidase [Ectothiorhodospiraceae bacterium]
MTTENAARSAAADGERHVHDPGRVTTLAAEVRRGSTTATALVERYLERIEAVEPAVCAWRVVDAERALAEAGVLDAETRAGHLRGPLHGVPVAVKDIIDVEGLPTRCNSPALQGRPPASVDAAVVTALRAAGAVILGKAHTTEFAFFDPSPARNPHHTGHTPGGSSSGSAAAVAAGMVPGSLGTQTVASVNRPAAYCGIAAYKPSSGLLPTHGVTPLAPVYDTVGFFGWNVSDATALFEAVCPAHAAAAPAPPGDRALHVVRLEDPLLDEATPTVTARVVEAASRMRAAGHTVETRRSCVAFESIRADQYTCAMHETGRVHRALLDLEPGRLGAKLREAIEHGLTIDHATYRAARARIDAARHELFVALADADAVLWPAAPDTAPPGLAWTGDPRFISPWTALGGPIVTVPVGVGDDALPIGALLCGAPGRDRAFASIARRLAAALGR